MIASKPYWNEKYFNQYLFLLTVNNNIGKKKLKIIWLIFLTPDFYFCILFMVIVCIPNFYRLEVMLGYHFMFCCFSLTFYYYYSSGSCINLIIIICRKRGWTFKWFHFYIWNCHEHICVWIISLEWIPKGVMTGWKYMGIFMALNRFCHIAFQRLVTMNLTLAMNICRLKWLF